MRYGAPVSITDAELAQVRQTAAYQGSLWMMRLEFVALAAFLWLLLLAPTALSWLPGALFGAAFVFAVAAIVLLQRAGYPVLRMRGSRPHDRRISRTVYRDILLLWRSPSPGRRLP